MRTEGEHSDPTTQLGLPVPYRLADVTWPQAAWAHCSLLPARGSPPTLSCSEPLPPRLGLAPVLRVTARGQPAPHTEGVIKGSLCLCLAVMAPSLLLETPLRSVPLRPARAVHLHPAVRGGSLAQMSPAAPWRPSFRDTRLPTRVSGSPAGCFSHNQSLAVPGGPKQPERNRYGD